MNAKTPNWLKNIGLVLILFGAVSAFRWAFLEEIDALAFDFVLRLRGEQPPDPGIVIVSIDDGSLQSLGPWPWAPADLDRLIGNILGAQPRAVGIDILLSHEIGDYTALDTEVPLVLASALGASSLEGGQGTFWQEPPLQNVGSRIAYGHIHADKDPDGICRSIPLSVSSTGTRRWAFAVELAREALEVPVEEVRYEADQLMIGRTPVPRQDNVIDRSIDSLGVLSSLAGDRLIINPRGGEGTFPYIAAADVYNGDPAALNGLAGKIVLVGATAYSLGDHLSTPFSGPTEMPGIEIHANALDTILGGRYLRPLREPWTTIGLFCVVALAWWVFSKWQRAKSLPVFLLFALAAVAFPIGLQLGLGIWVPLASIVSAVVLTASSVQFQHLAALNRQLDASFDDLSAMTHDEKRNTGAGRKWLSSRGKNLEWKIQLLRDATEQAIQSDQQKEKLLSFVSHELKTPLTSVRGFSELLLSGALSPSDRREATETIHEEVNRLNRLVEDFLQVSRLERGKGMSIKPCRLSPVLEAAIELVRSQAGSGHRIIAQSLAENESWVRGDATLLRQVFINLLTNAIKFSPENSEIAVSLQEDVHSAIVSVADQGCGIPESDRARIFDRFYRCPASQEHEIPGSGLGLAFVKEAVEQHEGSVTVESEPGRGSTFSVRLPLISKSAMEEQ